MNPRAAQKKARRELQLAWRTLQRVVGAIQTLVDTSAYLEGHGTNDVALQAATALQLRELDTQIAVQFVSFEAAASDVRRRLVEMGAPADDEGLMSADAAIDEQRENIAGFRRLIAKRINTWELTA